MSHSTNNRESEEDRVVEALLDLPRRNLESRIHDLQSEIRQRLQIKGSALSVLGTSRLRIQDRVFRLRYAGLVSQGSQLRQELVKEVSHLEQQIISETINCFRDLSVLKERLQKAREDLAFEEEKARLLS